MNSELPREKAEVSLNVHDVSVGVFVRGLTNLKAQLMKAEAQAVASGWGEARLLEARLGSGAPSGESVSSPRDLHAYTLAAQVHWAAEAAHLAIGNLLGDKPIPAASDARRFSDLQRQIDATIGYLTGIEAVDLEAGLDRTIVIEHPRGSMSSSGRQFLLAFAIPHFFYHLTNAYGILRSQGVQLTMGDFLGNWMAS